MCCCFSTSADRTPHHSPQQYKLRSLGGNHNSPSAAKLNSTGQPSRITTYANPGSPRISTNRRLHVPYEVATERNNHAEVLQLPPQEIESNWRLSESSLSNIINLCTLKLFKLVEQLLGRHSRIPESANNTAKVAIEELNRRQVLLTNFLAGQNLDALSLKERADLYRHFKEVIDAKGEDRLKLLRWLDKEDCDFEILARQFNLLESRLFTQAAKDAVAYLEDMLKHPHRLRENYKELYRLAEIARDNLDALGISNHNSNSKDRVFHLIEELLAKQNRFAPIEKRRYDDFRNLHEEAKRKGL